MIAWEMLLEMIPRNLIVKKNEVELEISLINGSTICLKGADNEDSLRGAGLDYVVLDEYGLMKPNVWEDIVRPMLTDRQSPALFIGTPKGKNHFWELWMKGQRHELNYSSYQLKTAMNPYILRSEIKDAEDQMNDRAFRQEYEASFEDFVGLIWPEFSHKQHVVDPFQLPEGCELIGAIDPALSGTTAVLIGAVDYSGQMYIISEYYEQNKRVSEISEAIKGKASRWWIDPSSFNRSVNREGKLYSLYDEYIDNGIVTLKAENDVNAGINRVAEFLKRDKVKIFRSCKNLIYELERYHWAEERETSLGLLDPRPYKSLDHACDAFRYLVMSRPQVPLLQKPRSKDRAMPLAYELLEEDAMKPGLRNWVPV